MWPRHLAAADGVAGMRHFELTSGWSPTPSTDASRAMAMADETENMQSLDDGPAEVGGMQFDDDDDDALVRVLHQVRRAYCRLLSGTDNDCSGNKAGELTGHHTSYKLNCVNFNRLYCGMFFE